MNNKTACFQSARVVCAGGSALCLRRVRVCGLPTCAPGGATSSRTLGVPLRRPPTAYCAPGAQSETPARRGKRPGRVQQECRRSPPHSWRPPGSSCAHGRKRTRRPSALRSLYPGSRCCVGLPGTHTRATRPGRAGGRGSGAAAARRPPAATQCALETRPRAAGTAEALPVTPAPPAHDSPTVQARETRLRTQRRARRRHCAAAVTWPPTRPTRGHVAPALVAVTWPRAAPHGPP